MLLLPDDVRRDRLISPEYRKQQEQLHLDPNYGRASEEYAPMVAKVMNTYGVERLLDYGCGKGNLGKTLMQGNLVDHPFRIQHYDPAVAKWADDPEPCEMVACLDVLEHIEPHLLDNVLDDLQRLTKFIGLFTVATQEAMKVLPDGRNAHLIVEGPGFWFPKIVERFEVHTFQKTPTGFFVLVTANAVEAH